MVTSASSRPASAERRWQQLGINLPDPPQPFGTYAEAVSWGKYESSFDPSEPEAYRHDVPKAEVHIVDGGHFALDTAADEIAPLVRGFLGSPR
jgi:hypothetical protein